MKGPAGLPTVEALVARCLTDPQFLDDVLRSPESRLAGVPENVRREADGLDFIKLRQFSGFIGKVQHNYLWEHFPATRHMLWKRGIEHAAFGAYRKEQLDPIHVVEDRPGRIRQFAGFLEGYLANNKEALILAVLLHERILWELRSCLICALPSATEMQTLSEVNWRDFQRLVTKMSPNARLASFNCDPLAAVDRVLAGDDLMFRIRSKKMTLLYRLDEVGDVRISEPDAMSALLLKSIVAAEPLSRLIERVRRAGFEAFPPRAFRGIFEEAAKAGVLQFEAQRCG